MTPPAKSMDGERVEEAEIHEQFVLQVEDHSRPAQDILTEQQESRAADESPALYVP